MIGLLSTLRLSPSGIKPKGEPVRKTRMGCPDCVLSQDSKGSWSVHKIKPVVRGEASRSSVMNLARVQQWMVLVTVVVSAEADDSLGGVRQPDANVPGLN